MEHLLGKRVLTVTKSGYQNVEIKELKILELSPSGKYVKVMNDYGQKHWKPVIEVQPIEMLEDKNRSELNGK